MNSRERNSGIDLLKFGAAVCIILGHINERFITPIPVTGLFGFTDVVELFFLISGYLSRDLDKLKNPQGIIKKIVRVYPMIFITTTVVIVLNEFAHVVYDEPSTGVLSIFASYLLAFKFSITPNQLGVDGNLWYIERAFRINKSDLAVRPIYHRLRNRIEGHICICFTAYSILLELERLLRANNSSISIKEAQELTKNMYALNYQLPKSRVMKRTILKMTPEQQKLYDLIPKKNQ